MESNIKPSVVPSIETMYKKLRSAGFTEDDLITLIQRKTKNSRTSIKLTLDALRSIEKRMIKAEEEK